MAVVAVATAGVVDGVVDDQERRLLDQQADAAEAVIQSSFSTLASTLPLLGALGQPGIGSPVLFDTVAGAFAGDDGLAGVAQEDGGEIVVQQAAGDGPQAGDELPASWTGLAERALTADGLVAEVHQAGGRRRLMLAVGIPGLAGVVAFAELSFDVDRLTQDSSDGPFSELDGAIYVGPDA
ncbi:MAG TPA: hypothetical protein VK507_10570, partial [Iamia sp.]|nr:hypothetical protein [Iamia sp.]